MGTVAVDTVAFEGMMRDIVGKLAQPSPKTNSQPQLEDLLSRLADRLETPEPTARLEGLVRDLADKIDTAAPGADQRALDSLQEQIARLAASLSIEADARMPARSAPSNTRFPIYSKGSNKPAGTADRRGRNCRPHGRSGCRSLSGGSPLSSESRMAVEEAQYGVVRAASSQTCVRSRRPLITKLMRL